MDAGRLLDALSATLLQENRAKQLPKIDNFTLLLLKSHVKTMTMSFVASMEHFYAFWLVWETDSPLFVLDVSWTNLVESCFTLPIPKTST